VEIVTIFSHVRNSYLAKRLHDEILSSGHLCHDKVAALARVVDEASSITDLKPTGDNTSTKSTETLPIEASPTFTTE
jgi:hypothetical protein